MDYIPQDGSEPDYVGLVFWILEAVIGTNKINLVFDILFLDIFFYLGSYQVLGFFIFAIVPEFVLHVIFFNIFPILDMPYIPWSAIFEAISQGDSSSDAGTATYNSRFN